MTSCDVHNTTQEIKNERKWEIENENQFLIKLLVLDESIKCLRNCLFWCFAIAWKIFCENTEGYGKKKWISSVMIRDEAKEWWNKYIGWRKHLGNWIKSSATDISLPKIVNTHPRRVIYAFISLKSLSMSSSIFLGFKPISYYIMFNGILWLHTYSSCMYLTKHEESAVE